MVGVGLVVGEREEERGLLVGWGRRGLVGSVSGLFMLAVPAIVLPLGSQTRLSEARLMSSLPGTSAAGTSPCFPSDDDVASVAGDPEAFSPAPDSARSSLRASLLVDRVLSSGILTAGPRSFFSPFPSLRSLIVDVKNAGFSSFISAPFGSFEKSSLKAVRFSAGGRSLS